MMGIESFDLQEKFNKTLERDKSFLNELLF